MTRQRQVQLLLWTYFWLLIFEGALRKWIFPGLSNPLLVVRDPVCILAIALGWDVLRRSGWWKWVVSIWAIGIAAVVLAVFAGHGDVFTAFYGARVLFLHFPLIFLYPLFFERDDIWKFVKALLIVAIPMTVLIALQYSLPQEHFWNRAPGGEEGGGFDGALGRFRPPGTFSFTNGVSSFYPLAAGAFAAWVVALPTRERGPLIWVSAAALILALPISISRTILFNYTLVITFTLIAAALSGRAVKNFFMGAAIVSVLFLAVSQLMLFREAREAFDERWFLANEAESGGEGITGVLANRVGGTFLDGVEMISEVPLAGMGIGLGTNVGAKLSTGERAFLVSEGAWGSAIGELGPILGILILIWRVALCALTAALAVVQALRRNSLPLILGSSVLPNLMIGGTAQPTALGFLVVGSGLMLAACNSTREMLMQHDPLVYFPEQDRGHA